MTPQAAAQPTSPAGAAQARALRRARRFIRETMASADRSLPPLAERTVLRLPGAQGPLEGRLYRPLGVDEAAPLLVFFHGGGFVVSDLDTHETLCIRLAQAAAMRVLSAEYRLAPEHRFPAQFDDAIAVARWAIGEGAPALRTAGKIAVGGDSAGAWLAAAAAARIHAETPGAIRAHLLLYPLLHLDTALWGERLFEESRILGWAVIWYINRQLAGAGGGPPALLSATDLAPVPTLIAAGGALDPCKREAALLAAALRAAGRPVVWRAYPGLVHGFGNLMTPISPAARAAVAEVGGLFGEIARDG
jgi:acetyl esterase